MPPRRRHRRGRLHREPHGGPPGGPGLRGRRGRQPRRRPRGEPRAAPRQPPGAVRRPRGHGDAPADSPLFKGRTTSSTSAASATSCRPSSARWTTCAPTSTARSRCWKRLGTPACASSCTPLRPPATASPPSCPPPRPRRSSPSIPTRSASISASARRSTGARSTGCRSISIRMFNVYGPRVKTTGAYGAVFGVFLAQKLHGKPFTVVGDGTQQRDFVYVTDVARAYPAGGRVGPQRRDLQSRRRRQAPDGQPAGRADGRRGRAPAEASGRARLHVGGHDEDPAAPGLGAHGVLPARGWRRCSGTSRTGAPRRCGHPTTIEAATATWFQHLAR